MAVQGFRGSKAGRVSIRVHFNQLALFTDGPVETPAEEAAEVVNEGKDSARRGDSKALAGELPADGAGSGETESPGPDGVRGAGEGGRPAVRTGVSTQDELSGGVGAGGRGVGAATERGPPADSTPPSGRSRSRTSSRKWRPHRRRGT